jgi:hypothetical protein
MPWLVSTGLAGLDSVSLLSLLGESASWDSEVSRPWTAFQWQAMAIKLQTNMGELN